MSFFLSFLDRGRGLAPRTRESSYAQCNIRVWIPASAGMTGLFAGMASLSKCHSCDRLYVYGFINKKSLVCKNATPGVLICDHLASRPPIDKANLSFACPSQCCGCKFTRCEFCIEVIWLTFVGQADGDITSCLQICVNL